MSEISTFAFQSTSVDEIRKNHYGINWPVVYLLLNDSSIYIGETTNFIARTRQHLANPDRKNFKDIIMVGDAQYNKSAILDIESHLIEYISGEGNRKITNKSAGIRHNYFDREKYLAKVELIWERLQEHGIVSKDLADIKNSDLFKYSPYKSLTIEQYEVANDIIEYTNHYTSSVQIVKGGPGTGKTVLALFLLRELINRGCVDKDKIALVVPMVSLRKTLSKVLRYSAGLSASMVIGPNDVVKKPYDILLVDEAHRLQRRKNITNYRAFDALNRELGLDNNGTQLDWVLNSSYRTILFYDEGQSVKPADVRPEDYHSIEKAKKYTLSNQLRVEGGVEYLRFVNDVFEGDVKTVYNIQQYDYQIFNDSTEFVNAVKSKNKELGLCRLVAGYAWPWISRDDSQSYDITIGNEKLKWNSTTNDWVNSVNSANEVGCIHTIQGYDLNYTGVIIGAEVSYDFDTAQIVIDESKYYDKKGKHGIDDPEELKGYIKNIYRVLLTRGIKGTYIYAVDNNLRKFLEKTSKSIRLEPDNTQTIS